MLRSLDQSHRGPPAKELLLDGHLGIEAVRRLARICPDDLLAKMYLQRALEYEEAPPDEAWDAIEVFKKK